VAPREQFYNEVRQDIHELKIRTEARGTSASLKKQVAILDEFTTSVNSLEQLETSATTQPMVRRAWDTARALIETPVKSFLAVELARKK
ncbi:MAG TPA: hypothetical protein VGR35_10730, partial [Tepidisphaeraceae bacterium]|nr:hypothetical protein [Tepidisphaeraceae bacterium]